MKNLGIPQVEYHQCSLDKIKINLTGSETTHKRRIESVEIAGKKVESSERFVNSLCSNVGISPNVFHYFEPEEVVSRIVERNNKSKFRFAIENGKTALAISRPEKQVVTVEKVLEVAKRQGVNDIEYYDGKLTTTHSPHVGGDDVTTIGGDGFLNRFMMNIPIDGYGLPNAFIMLLRQICTNGMVGFAPAFRTNVNIGDEAPAEVLNRFIGTFNNEEAYDAVHQRITASTKTPASLFEVGSVHQLLNGNGMMNMHERTMGRSNITNTLYRLAGSPLSKYGVVSFGSVTEKRARMLDTGCTMYDLINFVTEVGTHHASGSQRDRINAWVGQTITKEYDMENMMETAVPKTSNVAFLLGEKVAS